MNRVLKTIVLLSCLSCSNVTINIASAQNGNREVPTNTTYVVVDYSGKKTREYKPGEVMPLVMDGAYREVKCSKQIRSGARTKFVKCWRIVGSR